MVRSDIYFIDLHPRSGSEQSGRRPCIIISTDAFNQARGWRSLTVVPMTTSERWQTASPTTVFFAAGESGLPKNCAALAHQITTKPREDSGWQNWLAYPAKARRTQSSIKELPRPE
jgi:mRNA interferase MazF